MSKPTNKFESVPATKPDIIFATAAKCKKDNHPKKLNLGIGAYRDAQGKPYVLNVVKKAESIMHQRLLDNKETKEYDDMGGFKPFCDASVKLLYGPDMPALDTIASVVSLSGTGSIALAAGLAKFITSDHTPVYVSEETWPNHQAVFNKVGMHNMKSYRYYDADQKKLNCGNMLSDLADAPDGAIVILHGVGHNPTGCDPTQEEWQKICLLCKRKNFGVIFDVAYQGYASGNLDKDAYAPRLFARSGLQCMACQSYAKNLGLYGDRLGCFSVLCGDEDVAARVKGYVQSQLVRPAYSNPPRHPSRMAHLILTDPELRAEWESELKSMADRIYSVRKQLHSELLRLGTPGNWDHVINQIGMFSYLGLNEQQCNRLINEFHVYVLPTSRASLAGLTATTAPHLAKCIDAVVRGIDAKTLIGDVSKL